MEYKITTRNERETIELAQNFESEKFPNMIICLNGELGSGKTMFVKGIANALGIQDTITSPTFNIIKEYDGEIKKYNNIISELKIALQKHEDGCQDSFIEVPSMAEGRISNSYIAITNEISYTTSTLKNAQEERRMHVEGHNEYMNKLNEEMRKTQEEINKLK